MMKFLKYADFSFAGILVAVLIGAVGSGCGEVVETHYDSMKERGRIQASYVGEVTDFSKNYTGGTFLTVKHDGHLWVVLRYGPSGVAFQHHPDCPCLKDIKIEADEP